MTSNGALPHDPRPTPPSSGSDPSNTPETEAIRLLLSLGHESQTQDPDRAADCFLRATELARRAGHTLDEARALCGLGRLRTQAGRFAEAEAHLTVASDLLGSLDAPLDAFVLANALAMLHLHQGHVDEALDLLHTNAAAASGLPAGEQSDRARAEALEHLGTAHRERGDLPEALRRFEAALELRRGARDAVGVAADLDHLGKLHMRLGQYQEAQAQLREALEKRRALRDRSGASVTANHLASVLVVLGELDEARLLYDECRTFFEETGQVRALARVQSNLGLLETAQGNVDAAQQHLNASLERLRGLGDLPGEANALNNLSSLALVRGRPEEAIDLARECLAIRREAGADSGLAKPLLNLGYALLELGRTVEARAVATEALDVAGRIGSLDQKAEVLCLLASPVLTTIPDQAARNATEARECAAATGDSRLLAGVEVCVGSLEIERGQLQLAQEALSRARRHFRGSGDAFDGAVLLLEEGRLLARADAPEAAAERLRRADQEFARLGNARWRMKALVELAALLEHDSPDEARVRLETARALAREHGLSLPALPPSTASAARGTVRALEIALETWDGRDKTTPERAIEALGRLLSTSTEIRAAELRFGGTNTERFAMSGFSKWIDGRDDAGRLRVAIPAASTQVNTRDGGATTREFALGSSDDVLLVAFDHAGGGAGDADSMVRLAARFFGCWFEHAAWSSTERAAGPEELAGFEGLIGGSPAIQEAIRLLLRAAASDATVLLLGESGTGKELAARAIHARSARRDAPFVAISCPSIPKDLVEAELFGHEKGAFTGATTARPGKIELAAGGCLFLDEIGDVAPGVQVKLLRFLQEREFERVGGRKPLRVDVRVIAATSRDLESAVREDGFRKDLYYRLNVFQVRLPSLRERKHDLQALVDQFLTRHTHSGRHGEIRLAAETMDLLRRHDWPGNVRELQNAVEYMLATADGSLLEPRHLPVTLRESILRTASGSEALRIGENLSARVGQLEARLILATLEECGWNQSAAARRLGITEGTVRNRIRRYGLAPSTTPQKTASGSPVRRTQ